MKKITILKISLIILVVVVSFFAYEYFIKPNKESVATERGSFKTEDKENKLNNAKSQNVNFEQEVNPELQKEPKQEIIEKDLALKKCKISTQSVSIRTADEYNIFGASVFDTVVCGFLVKETIPRPFEIEGTQTNAYFQIIEFMDDDFKKSIQQGVADGNSVNNIKDEKINFNLGCIEGNLIKADSDYQNEGGYLDKETTKAILHSSKAKPIALKLSFGMHDGRGCMCCNLAHNIRLIK